MGKRKSVYLSFRVTQDLSNDIKIITLWQTLDFLWFFKQHFEKSQKSGLKYKYLPIQSERFVSCVKKQNLLKTKQL